MRVGSSLVLIVALFIICEIHESLLLYLVYILSVSNHQRIGLFGRSLNCYVDHTDRINRSGPTIVPCGIPAEMFNDDEIFPFRSIICCRSRDKGSRKGRGDKVGLIRYLYYCRIYMVQVRSDTFMRMRYSGILIS